jgi:hypothetical protein
MESSSFDVAMKMHFVNQIIKRDCNATRNHTIEGVFLGYAETFEKLKNELNNKICTVNDYNNPYNEIQGTITEPTYRLFNKNIKQLLDVLEKNKNIDKQISDTIYSFIVDKIRAFIEKDVKVCRLEKPPRYQEIIEQTCAHNKNITKVTRKECEPAIYVEDLKKIPKKAMDRLQKIFGDQIFKLNENQKNCLDKYSQPEISHPIIIADKSNYDEESYKKDLESRGIKAKNSNPVDLTKENKINPSTIDFKALEEESKQVQEMPILKRIEKKEKEESTGICSKLVSVVAAVALLAILARQMI